MHIYVGNLSMETTESDLRQEFAGFGEVVSVVIMNDEYIGSGQPRAYGYVEMASKAAGTAAIAGLEGKAIREMPVTVVEALPLTREKRGASRKVPNPNRTVKPRIRD